MNTDAPTLWVCLHCGKWYEDRYQLNDVACYLNAREFNRYDVMFSREASDVIVSIRAHQEDEVHD